MTREEYESIRVGSLVQLVEGSYLGMLGVVFQKEDGKFSSSSSCWRVFSQKYLDTNWAIYEDELDTWRLLRK